MNIFYLLNFFSFFGARYSLDFNFPKFKITKLINKHQIIVATNEMMVFLASFVHIVLG